MLIPFFYWAPSIDLGSGDSHEYGIHTVAFCCVALRRVALIIQAVVLGSVALLVVG